jgi:hypothetical protein
VFDLRPLFASGTLETESGGYRFLLNPCPSVQCANHEDDVAVCQESLTVSNSSFSLGRVHTVSYDISGSTPAANQWLVIGTYFMGDASGNRNRTAQVRYIFNSTASNPVFTFFSEDLSQLNYFFEVESNLIEPRFPSPQAQSIPVVGWVFIGLGLAIVVALVLGVTIVCIAIQVRRFGYQRLASEDDSTSDGRPPRQGSLQWTLLADNKESRISGEGEK